MAKLVKQYYINMKGDKKINCYKATISKEILRKANINGDNEIKIYAIDNKVILEQNENNEQKRNSKENV